MANIEVRKVPGSEEKGPDGKIIAFTVIMTPKQILALMDGDEDEE